MSTANYIEWTWVFFFGVLLLAAGFLTYQKWQDLRVRALDGLNGWRTLFTNLEFLTEIAFLVVLLGYELTGIQLLFSPATTRTGGPSDNQIRVFLMYLVAGVLIGAREIYALYVLRAWDEMDHERRSKEKV